LKLLHVVRTVNPDAGGPIEGVRQRGLRLLQMGHTVEVVTLDAPGEAFVAKFPLKSHAVGPSKGGYGYNAELVPWLKRHARHYDAIVVNGIWEYHSFAAWRALHALDVPYFVFTHGMLDPWFKHTYPLKHLKKWAYWPWATYRLLRDARAVLFTTEEERLQARKSFWLYRVKEQVVAYGTSAPPENVAEAREHFLAANAQLRGKRLLLFLSRIHEKKGCDLLIEAFAETAKAHRDLHLVMAGPDQTGWVAHLKTLAQKFAIEDRICWPGMLQGQMKWGAFYSAEAFVLPSHQENFGIAVAEALACGLPVLISDKVNIWHEVKGCRAGLVAPDTLQGTRNVLSEWLAMTPAERQDMGVRARGLFRERFTIDAMANSLLEVVRQYGSEKLERVS
jgi:glycosyltransferase involved in cell wall biosynthesis